MNWVLIGTFLGSTLMSVHDSREACEGRAVVLREAKAAVICVQAPSNTIGITTTPSPFSWQRSN